MGEIANHQAAYWAAQAALTLHREDCLACYLGRACPDEAGASDRVDAAWDALDSARPSPSAAGEGVA